MSSDEEDYNKMHETYYALDGENDESFRQNGGQTNGLTDVLGF